MSGGHPSGCLVKYIIIKIIGFVKEEEREHQIIEKRNIGLYIVCFSGKSADGQTIRSKLYGLSTKKRKNKQTREIYGKIEIRSLYAYPGNWEGDSIRFGVLRKGWCL